MSHSSSRALEKLAVIGLCAVSFAFQWVFLPLQLKGPDTRKFLEIADLAQRANFWTDPRAFDGNYWSVGYPTFLAVVRSVAGAEVFPIQVIQALLAASLVVFTWALCRASGPAVRLTTAGVAAISPSLVFIGWNGGYEVLLGWLVVASITVAWGFGGSPEGPQWWRMWGAGAIAGLALGLAFMVQNKVLVILPVIAYLLCRWGRSTVLSFSALLLLPIAAWSTRNFLVRGTSSPFNTNGPVNVWIGNNPEAVTGGFMEPPPLPSDASGFLDATLMFWVSQPEASIQLLLRRTARLLEPVFIYPEVQFPLGGTLILHVFTFALSASLLILFATYAFGRLWVSPPSLPAVGPLALMWLAFLLVHLPFLAEARFRTPLEPVLIAVAVPTAFVLARRFRTRIRGADAPTTA